MDRALYPERPDWAGGGLNTYGYVGGNPLRFIDPLGLAQEDVDRAINIISSCEPLIWNPNVSVKLSDLPSVYLGITDRKTRNITLSKSAFGGQLDESQKYHLLSTLAHEYMHSKQSTISWYALGFDDFLGEPIGMHTKIVRDSMDLRQETYDAWNDRKNSCECD